ncbi:MAG: hypothetical protein IPH48_17860 [bacterium]|nr:hypothetical protein [bacterium]
MKSILAILIITLVCAQPASARTEVSPPDTSSEDLASVALIGANLALAAQLGRHLQHDLPGRTWGWIGVGAGAASLVLGGKEWTSFPGGVFATGALVAVLGTVQLTSHGDVAEPRSGGDVMSRSVSISPLVTSSGMSGMGIGILTRVAF